MQTTTTRPRRPGALLAVLLTAPFLAQADATIANVATPAIPAGLGASPAAAELVVGGYLISYAVLLITGARLGQTHSYKARSCSGSRCSASARWSAAWPPMPPSWSS